MQTEGQARVGVRAAALEKRGGLAVEHGDAELERRCGGCFILFHLVSSCCVHQLSMMGSSQLLPVEAKASSLHVSAVG